MAVQAGSHPTATSCQVMGTWYPSTGGHQRVHGQLRLNAQGLVVDNESLPVCAEQLLSPAGAPFQVLREPRVKESRAWSVVGLLQLLSLTPGSVPSKAAPDCTLISTSSPHGDCVLWVYEGDSEPIVRHGTQLTAEARSGLGDRAVRSWTWSQWSDTRRCMVGGAAAQTLHASRPKLPRGFNWLTRRL
jgi:hypothetical protein